MGVSVFVQGQEESEVRGSLLEAFAMQEMELSDM